jgi:hypothetical protein
MSPHSVDDTSILADEVLITTEKGAHSETTIKSLAVRPPNESASTTFELEDHPIDATTPLRVCSFLISRFKY